MIVLLKGTMRNDRTAASIEYAAAYYEYLEETNSSITAPETRYFALAIKIGGAHYRFKQTNPCVYGGHGIILQ